MNADPFIIHCLLWQWLFWSADRRLLEHRLCTRIGFYRQSAEPDRFKKIGQNIIRWIILVGPHGRQSLWDPKINISKLSWIFLDAENAGSIYQENSNDIFFKLLYKYIKFMFVFIFISEQHVLTRYWHVLATHLTVNIWNRSHTLSITCQDTARTNFPQIKRHVVFSVTSWIHSECIRISIDWKMEDWKTFRNIIEVSYLTIDANVCGPSWIAFPSDDCNGVRV